MSASETASSAILCESLTRLYPGAARPAVDQVNFQVPAGNLVVLLGPSGCGKTTLLKMVNRLIEPTSGKIWIEGKEIHDLPATELRRRIGYVIQQVGLFPHMTIDQNISVVPRLLKWDRKRIGERVRSLLDLVGLPAAYLTRYPRQLSGGEQQRVGLARALAADPAILLMDEPFAAVDAINRERLQGALLEIQQQVRKTILFVTHDVEEAFRLADKIAVLKDGKLIQFDAPLEIVTHPQNAFVQELVGTQNKLRRLSLVTVQSVLNARRSWASETALDHLNLNPVMNVHPEDDLRSALSVLLQTSGRALNVVDAGGNRVGEITLDDLRATLIEHAPDQREQSGDELSD
jgi:osmoprotectant transport system ATP-binding protein